VAVHLESAAQSSMAKRCTARQRRCSWLAWCSRTA